MREDTYCHLLSLKGKDDSFSDLIDQINLEIFSPL